MAPSFRRGASFFIAMMKFGKPWWMLSAELAAQAIVELQKEYDRVNSWRRSRARRLIGGYQNRNLNVPFAREDAGGYTWGEGPDEDDTSSRYRLVRNKFYEYVETYVSKVGADENPQPALMVTDGDWTLKRQVTLATRLLEAEYDQRQGLYSDAYALARHGLRMAWGGTGSVAAKIYPWPKEDRVVIELHDTLDMFLDDTELAYNNPRTFGEKTWWPPERLAQSYPSHRKAIEDAVKPRDDLGLAYNEVFGKVEMVPVYEAWAVKLGDEVGRHIAVLEDGTVLVDEEWDDEEPPYAFFHASPSMVGFWGTPPTEYVYDEILKVNEIVQACDFAHTHTDKRVHYVNEQTLADISEIESVRGVKVVRLKSNAIQPPVMENPSPFNRIDLDLLANHEAAIARTLGIDEMHSGARAEPGLPSAVAQREAASRFDDRAADGHRAFQHWVAVDFARHILKAQRRLYENNRAFKREWTGEFFSKEIHAKDIVDLDYNALRVRIKPIGEKKNTPEERVQFAQELMEQGAIPYEAYAAVLEHYDTPGETRVIKTQRRWIAWQIDTWLMTKDAEPVQYMSPRPWMRKSDALVQVIDALMEAEMNDVPPDRLQHFLDFIAELVQQMSNEVNPPQAPAPPLGVLPPAQGAAGMNAGAQGLMAPGLVPGAPPAAPPMAGPPPGGAPIV